MSEYLAEAADSRISQRDQQHPSNESFAELKKIIREKGLLEKQPAFLWTKIAANLLTLAASLAVLFLVDVFWVQLLNAVFLAFIFGQTGFIAHDVGHRQGFRSTRANDWAGLVHGNLLIGMSYGWWLDKHNQHHAHPNEDDLDPDIAIPFIAFSEKDAREKRGILRQFVKYQSILFFPLLLFESLSLRAGSIGYLIRNKEWKFRNVEALFILLHFGWFFSAIFLALPFWQAVVFILVQQALFGFYLSIVFAPNHKGMLVIEKGRKIDFLRQQVLTARNVRAHPVTDFWYGGLNYQIEHHLFPGMARNKLEEAQQVIRKFCEERGVSYYETSMLRSYVEILQYLHAVSAPLRKGQISQSPLHS